MAANKLIEADAYGEPARTFVRSQGDFALASAMQTLLQLESVGIMEVLDIRQTLGRHSVENAVTKATDYDIAEMERISKRFARTNKRLFR